MFIFIVKQRVTSWNERSKENLEFVRKPDDCCISEISNVEIKKNRIDEKFCEKLQPKCCVPNCINQSGKVFSFPKDER